MVNLGVAVKPDEQVQPKIRPTPDGGCYISWFDNDPTGSPPFGYDVFQLFCLVVDSHHKC